MKNKVDSLNAEYTELAKTLQGINPILSTYATIKKRMEEIKQEIGGSHRINHTPLKRIKKNVRFVAPHHYVHG